MEWLSHITEILLLDQPEIKNVATLVLNAQKAKNPGINQGVRITALRGFQTSKYVH